MTDKTPIADLNLPSDKIDSLRLIYGLIGRFEYGLPFNASVIPVAHIASLFPRFMQFLIESEASDERIDTFRGLYVELTGIELPQVDRKTQGRFTAEAGKPRIPERKREVSGVVDYAAAVNSILEENAQ